MGLGIIRKLDNLGRITIAKEFREELNIKDHERLRTTLEGDRIIVSKISNKVDIFDGKTNRDLIEYKGKYVSKKTILNLNELLKKYEDE